jgi:predicted phage tail protein
MLREIKVYGELAKFVGQKLFQAEIGTAAEAIRFLVANFPGLDQHMADRHYKVIVGQDSLAMDEIHNPSGQQAIKIVPVVAGAGGGAGGILAGIALVTAAILLGPAGSVFGLAAGFGATAATATAAATAGGFIGAAAATALGGIGFSLVIGGVAQLISPAAMPSTGGGGSTSDPRQSYSFSGVQNVSRQGVPVPIIFGEVIVGSITVSAGIDIAQVTA